MQIVGLQQSTRGGKKGEMAFHFESTIAHQQLGG
jgi:hypothetical protein